ncbi:MFS transporter [Gordonibacter massiliensis]|uniref:MFS transporter n=2 Tax=Gordonibacter massiliensis (ex Traore et al. 2017) TaxID=1841863 RepID=A0A842JC12_9ACTN|nr:MFS transporter [Gordonibacter massiliensis (ex Traore et al. 2017)]
MAMSETGTKRSLFPYAVVATGIMGCFGPCALALSCAGIFFTPVSTALGVGRGVFAIYLTVMLVACAIALPFEGKLMEKKDLRVLLSAAVLCIGVPLICMSFFNEVWQFYIAGAFMGIGLAFLLVLAVPTLINRWFRKNVGFYIGLCMAFTGIGGVVFNLVGGMFIASGPDGWRMGYLAFGVLALVLALPFTLFGIRSYPGDKGLTPVGSEAAVANGEAAVAALTGPTASRAMKTLSFFALAIFAGFINLAINFYQYLPSYASSLTQYPDIVAIAATLASAAMLGQAIGKVLLGIINDKLSVYAGLGLSTGCGAVGLLVMWLVPSSVPAMLAGGFLFGVFYASATVLAPLITRTIFGTREYSTIYSRVAMVGSLCGAFAASVWGFIVDGTGFSFVFAIGIGGAVIVFLLGLLALRSGKGLADE